MDGWVLFPRHASVASLACRLLVTLYLLPFFPIHPYQLRSIGSPVPRPWIPWSIVSNSHSNYSSDEAWSAPRSWVRSVELMISSSFFWQPAVFGIGIIKRLSNLVVCLQVHQSISRCNPIYILSSTRLHTSIQRLGSRWPLHRFYLLTSLHTSIHTSYTLTD